MGKKPGSEPNPIRKNSIKPEPKLIKYPNGFKILVFKEQKPNPTRTEVSRILFGILVFIYLSITYF